MQPESTKSEGEPLNRRNSNRFEFRHLLASRRVPVQYGVTDLEHNVETLRDLEARSRGRSSGAASEDSAASEEEEKPSRSDPSEATS